MKPADFYNACLDALNPDIPSEWPDIAGAYNGRAYHNLNHLEEMLGHLPSLSTSLAPAAAPSPEQSYDPEKVAPELGNAPVFGIALIYHDIVYRELLQPPRRTAHFSRKRRLGVVLRVSSTVTGRSSTSKA